MNAPILSIKATEMPVDQAAANNPKKRNRDYRITSINCLEVQLIQGVKKKVHYFDKQLSKCFVFLRYEYLIFLLVIKSLKYVVVLNVS